MNGSIAIATLTRLRDEAWAQAEHHIGIYRAHRIDGALTEHKAWKLKYETLDDALQAVQYDMYGEPDGDTEPGYPDDGFADAEVFASIGWGTDEDYGYFGGGFDD